MLNELKLIHATSPKYTFAEVPQSEVLKKFSVEVISLKAMYLRHPQAKGVVIMDDGGPCDVEEFASRHFRKQGFKTLFVESVPFHLLFGVFMWLVIQDPADPQVRIVSFGDRHAFDNHTKGALISTHLPDDFGKPGYGRRRGGAIDAHFSSIKSNAAELKWLFDYWLKPSEGLRQYLWAHRQEDIQTARQLIDVLPTDAITKILRYLADDYWGRYLGWPDLLVHRGAEFFFAEIKSSGDKLSEDQKHWIGDNDGYLNFPFKLVKVHKTATVTI